MEYQIIEGPVINLAEYARLPISFQVDRFLAVTQVDGGLGGLILTERRVDQPYIKNYDTIEGNSPTSWAHRWDLSNWCMLSVLIFGAPRRRRSNRLRYRGGGHARRPG